MSQLFANNASSLLAASITDIETTIQVTSGFGVLFPSPTGSDFFLVTLENEDGDIEICKCTARSTDLLTVVRGQEGTTAMAWVNGQARVEVRNTKETMEAFIQRTGDAMEGNLDMDGNNVIDAHLTGSGTKILAGEIVNVPIRGATGVATNQLSVPTNGTSRAQAGGKDIVVQDDLDDATTVEAITTLAFVVGQIVLWYGAIGDIPDGWARCNGANGTPDLRDRFPLGAGSTYAFDSTGGAASAASSAAGAHTPVIQGHVLTPAETPIGEHTHDLYVYTGGHSSDVDGFSASGDAAGLAGQDSGPHAYQTDGQTGQQLVDDADGGGTPDAHSHTATAVPDHTHTVATLPPYRALHFIMFIGF